MERAAVPSMIREQRLNQWIENYSDSICGPVFFICPIRSRLRMRHRTRGSKLGNIWMISNGKASPMKRHGFYA